MAENAHEVHDQGDNEDQAQQASANYGTTKIKAAAAEQEQEHD